jgi:hypothetical protein
MFEGRKTMQQQDLSTPEQFEFKIKFRAQEDGGAPRSRSKRQTFGRGRAKTPQQFNGIHRRRRKKIRW